MNRFLEKGLRLNRNEVKIFTILNSPFFKDKIDELLNQDNLNSALFKDKINEFLSQELLNRLISKYNKKELDNLLKDDFLDFPNKILIEELLNNFKDKTLKSKVDEFINKDLSNSSFSEIFKDEVNEFLEKESLFDLYDLQEKKDNCLLHSVCFSYLFPILGESEELKKRINNLFEKEGEKEFNNLSLFLKGLIINLNNSNVFIDKVHKEVQWNKLVQNLEKKVIDFIKNHKDESINWIKENYHPNPFLIKSAEALYNDIMEGKSLEDGLLEKLKLFALSNIIKRPIDLFITNEGRVDKINFGVGFFKDSSIKISFSDHHYNFRLTFKEIEYIKTLSKSLENTTIKAKFIQPSNSLEEEKEHHISKTTMVSHNQEGFSSANPSTSVSSNTMKEDLNKAQKDKVVLPLKPIIEKMDKRKNRKEKTKGHLRSLKR